MFKARNAGKKLLAVRIVKDTFEIIHLLTDANPLQVLVQAIINSGPREDSTRIGSAGVVRRQAVDVSPFRRVNQALYLIAHGVSSFELRYFELAARVVGSKGISRRACMVICSEPGLWQRRF